MSVFLGRQPILDDSRRTVGYELLYRQDDQEANFFADPVDSARAVVERTMLEWGLNTLVGNGIAFVNVDPTVLQSELYTALPADRVVLKLRESSEFAPATIDALRHASLLGYRIALDDLITTSPTGLAQVLPMVDIVKVEVALLDPAHVHEVVQRLRSAAPRAMLLADRVDSIELFERCRRLGFDLFQGYFFAEPELLERPSRPTNQQAALSLMVAVQDPDITIDELATLADSDPTLTYRLLKLVNSSATGMPHTIDSVRHAIVMLGIERVRQLAALLTMSSTSATNPELITLSVTRAHMARRLLGDAIEASSAFTAGMLSVIDAVFGSPMHDLLDDLPVTDDVRKALLFGAGPIGEALQIIRAYERADVRELELYRPLGLDAVRDAFGMATASATAFNRQLEMLTPLRGR